MKKLNIILTMLFVASLTITGCRETKSTGEKIEDGVEEVGDGIEDAADDVEDEVEDAVDDN